MNLILWRHAEAEEGFPDLGRALTQKGQAQARRVAAWLNAHMPASTRILVSPATRTQQTAQALQRPFQTITSIAPEAPPEAVLAAADWSQANDETVLIVGHQPTLGQVTSLLLFGEARAFSVKKGGVIWLARRERLGEGEVTLRAAITPSLLD